MFSSSSFASRSLFFMQFALLDFYFYAIFIALYGLFELIFSININGTFIVEKLKIVDCVLSVSNVSNHGDALTNGPQLNNYGKIAFKIINQAFVLEFHNKML